MLFWSMYGELSFHYLLNNVIMYELLFDYATNVFFDLKYLNHHFSLVEFCCADDLIMCLQHTMIVAMMYPTWRNSYINVTVFILHIHTPLKLNSSVVYI